MSDWTLRVVWPIEDPAMYEAEAIADARRQLPAFAEERQVTLTREPVLRVAPLSPAQQAGFGGATRVVVAEVPVIRRATTTATPVRKAA